jgi:hypothetical protein
MKNLLAFLFATWVLGLAGTGCEGASETGKSNGGSDADGDSDGDSDTDIDADADGDTDIPSGSGTIHGTVNAPSGTFPIPGALVYLTTQTVEGINSSNPIPNEIFCYDCDDMTGKKWTLTNADGSFTLSSVPAGTWRLVTRKGFFRRISEITIDEGEVEDVPVELTTLPRENSADGADRIPNYAVLLNWYDRSEDLLAKLGIAEIGGDGHFVPGSEQFDVYNDAQSATSALGPSSMVFASQDSLDQYHMVFFPCICSTLSATNYPQMLRNYVAEGGKLYSSCWASQWVAQPFPAMISFHGGNSGTNPGDIGSYDATGAIIDQQMRDWLTVVTPAENLDAYPFHGAWILIDSINDVDNGMGLPEDDYWVKPKSWVADNGGGFMPARPAGSPMTVTYNFGCGKVFYSVYQVVESSSSTQIRPQEYVLLYLILEVGVCEGEYEPPV